MTRIPAPLHHRVAALVLAVSTLATCMPAAAQYRRGDYHRPPPPPPRGHYDRGYDRHRGGSDAGVAIAAGLLGVVAGAAIANSSQRTYSPPPQVVYSQPAPPPPPPPGVVYYEQ